MNKKSITAIFLYLFTLVVPFTTALSLTPEDIVLHGKFRLRGFYFNGTGDIPGQMEGSGTKQLTYGDLFFRNTLLFNISQDLQVFTMLDAYAVIGEFDGALNSSDLGFQIRLAYVTWKIFDKGTLEAGFLPFSISKGYYLANNGGGIKYKHELPGGVVPYVYYIKAYDASRAFINGGIGQADFRDNDIFAAGIQYKQLSFIHADLFYTVQNDSESVIDPVKVMHWGGISLKAPLQNFTIEADTIYNWGTINDVTLTDIHAFLATLKLNYQFSITTHAMKLSAFGGVTSGDLNNPAASNHFQAIGYAHTITNMAIDSGGGLALFGNGSGLYHFGAELKYHAEKFSALLRGAHFITYSGDANAGTEADLILQYHHIEGVEFFINNALFFPGSGYPFLKAGVNDPYLYEFFAGAQFSY